MPSTLPQGTQNLNDCLQKLVKSQTGVSPQEEADFIKKFLPNQTFTKK